MGLVRDGYYNKLNFFSSLSFGMVLLTIAHAAGSLGMVCLCLLEDTSDVFGELGTFHTVHLVCLSLWVDSYPLPLSAAPYKSAGSTGDDFYPVLRF
jgi:hypothetical protein